MGQMTINRSILKTVSRVKEKNNLDEHILLCELFPESFMKEHTQFSTIEELFEDGLYFYSHNETISADEEDIDGYIFITTDFTTWEEMADTAVKEYCARDRRNA